MSVYNVTNSNASEAAARAYKEQNNRELDKNAFMKVLIAQMTHQDPLEPMKDSDFIAQMAQFTTLENMQAMSSTMTMNNAYSLIGKFVSFIDPLTGNEIAGRVSSVFSENGEPRLQVGDFILKMKGVISVYDSSVFEPGMSNEDIIKAIEELRKAVAGATGENDDNKNENDNGQTGGVTGDPDGNDGTGGVTGPDDTNDPDGEPGTGNPPEVDPEP